MKLRKQIQVGKDSNPQTDSEIIEDYKSVKIKLRISFIFIEFDIKGRRQENQ